MIIQSYLSTFYISHCKCIIIWIITTYINRSKYPTEYLAIFINL